MLEASRALQAGRPHDWGVLIVAALDPGGIGLRIEQARFSYRAFL